MIDLHDNLMREANPGKPFTTLLDTAVKWAEYALKHTDSKELEAGLNISKALANYYYAIREGGNK